MKAKPTVVNLYWTTTPDHSEDWFIFARSSQEATDYHKDYEGYDTARSFLVVGKIKVLEVPETLPTHAQLPALEKLGFEVLSRGPQRIVRYRGKEYIEGGLQAEIDGL